MPDVKERTISDFGEQRTAFRGDPGSPTLSRRAGLIAWIAVWTGAVGLVALVHLAFFFHWPDHFIHEDSAAYLDEAQAILTGHYVDQPGYRPYGVAFFLVLLSKLLAPNILVFAATQHVLSIGSALLIAAIVRLSGARPVFALLAFLLAGLFPRTVHYDNTIGAETISVFLTTLAAFLAAGVVFRKWPPLIVAVGIGLAIGATMVCRSAAVGAGTVILLWLAIFMADGWGRRVGAIGLAGAIAIAVYLAPGVIGELLGKVSPDSESLSVMAFPVGYSGDFTRGVHLDRKALARAFVEKKRAENGPQGWAGSDEYQWPLDAMALMRKPDESRADLEKVVRDIFVETMTTPSTLWRHLSRHFLREMYFLLFDVSQVARRVATPENYEWFVKCDIFPIFQSPTGQKYPELLFESYSPPKALSWLLPSPGGLRSLLDRLFEAGYAPFLHPAPLCCGITISTEYDFRGGPIRWLSGCTLVLVLVLLVGRIRARRGGGIPPLPRNLVAVGILMILLAFINAAFPAFLVYGLNRYAYYVTPFLSGATCILGALLYEHFRQPSPLRKPAVELGG